MYKKEKQQHTLTALWDMRSYLRCLAKKFALNQPLCATVQ